MSTARKSRAPGSGAAKRRIPIRVGDLRGVQQLANDATVGITDLVEAMHDAVLRTPGVLARRSDGRTRGITGLVYRSIRGVTRLVGASADMLFDAVERYVEDEPSSHEREAVLAALNGIFGDYLWNTRNPLAIPMGLRSGGLAISCSKDALAKAFPAPSSRLLVLVHGLCMNDLQWTRNGHDHGAALAKDLGYTPLYLHYNTGRHVSDNGRDFSAAMQVLVREWPHAIEQLALLGHSMGGLVIRSGCQHASVAGHTWPERLDRIVFLATRTSGHRSSGRASSQISSCKSALTARRSRVSGWRAARASKTSGTVTCATSLGERTATVAAGPSLGHCR